MKEKATIIKTKTKHMFPNKMFITKQESGIWVATILYMNDGEFTYHNEVAYEKLEAYRMITEWFLNEFDDKAIFDKL